MGQSNTASGDNSFAAGTTGTASGDNSSAPGGSVARATGDYSFAAGGSHTTASGDYSFASNDTTTASAISSFASGTESVASLVAQEAHAGGAFVTAGDAQYSSVPLKVISTSGTPVALVGQAGDPIFIRSGFTYGFTATILGRKTTGTKHARFHVSGIIANNAGTTALVGAVTTWADDGSEATWSIAVTADNATDSLALTVTGEATVRWVARVDLEEVGT